MRFWSFLAYLEILGSLRHPAANANSALGHKYILHFLCYSTINKETGIIKTCFFEIYVKLRPHLQHFPTKKHEQTEQTVQTLQMEKTLSIRDG